ncbi:TIGR02647 family protein [Gallaecimonas kandeliae]|uniref:TIGR02647 family protein n=1 Tax=Gallaecimonas kandeliae TaxID=3029055 RepID=UPI0026498E2F|nr:TIGR02647 family protein [Gallaecimonas kandeliae]WKE65623.1 TIGR02647 family protein [Gallaecimonas kandeliae]
MALPQELLTELDMLSRFSLDSVQTGLKVHHDAAPELVAATNRLFEKGLVTLPDGGYLTELGRETAEHLKLALTILRSQSALA